MSRPITMASVPIAPASRPPVAIVAHRGIHHEHPENSIEALLAAWAAGFTWCECDVRGSMDHEPFLLHDETLERTTTGRGKVEETRAEQLRTLRLVRGDGSVTGVTVPTLAGLLRAMPPRARLLLEIKPYVHRDAVRRTLEQIVRGDDRVVVQSFDPRILVQAAELRPDVPRALLVEDARGPFARQEGPWSAVNAQFKTLHADIVKTLRGRGLGVGGWTINSDADIRRALQLGLDTIISDRPDVACHLAGVGKSGKPALSLSEAVPTMEISSTEDPTEKPKEATAPKKPVKAEASGAQPSAPAQGSQPQEQSGLDFIRRIIEEDRRTGKWAGRVATRFPPEPNGYLHIGHAKSIYLNFGVAEEYHGTCNLRYDDTNPAKEEEEYVRSIEEDVKWLGFTWSSKLWASDYFDTMYAYAQELIRKGLAYVDDQTADEIRINRGTLTRPGKDSPYRNRSAEENLDLFERMRKGEFPDGSKVLRAKIDMASPNLNLRDPVMYRILHEAHHNTGTKWCIYPMYDWAHGFEDSIEKVTHSLCTLEFENHRPLYDWFIAAVNRDRPAEKKIWHPQQIEFARLNLTYTMLSKRKLLALVEDKIVSGWDDPRMPTISGFRRKGYTPESIRAFCRHIGLNKFDSTVEINVLENFLRDDLNKRAPRRMAVLRPLKVVITNYPQGQSEELDAVNNPEDAAAGTRKVPFSRTLYIEQDDFRESPPPKYFRLAPGVEVRLRYAYFVRCTDVVKDAAGNVTEVYCTYDPATRGGDAPDGRKVKGTIHWVSADHAVPAEVRLYDHLFRTPHPEDVPEGQDWRANLNPNSLEVVQARLESNLKSAKPGDTFQFERLGYFTADRDSAEGRPVFNRTVTLKDTWAKEEKKGKK